MGVALSVESAIDPLGVRDERDRWVQWYAAAIEVRRGKIVRPSEGLDGLSRTPARLLSSGSYTVAKALSTTRCGRTKPPGAWTGGIICEKHNFDGQYKINGLE